MTRKYYIRMDGDVFGPYSAKGMLALDLLPDIMVTEVSMDVWQPAESFDFATLAKQEVLERLKSTPTNDTPPTDVSLEQKRNELKSRLSNKGNLTVRPGYLENKNISNAFPESAGYKANFNEGLNSIGGKIVITPSQLIFKAHAFNFGDMTDRVFEISQISGYEKGMLSFLYISFVNGSRIKLTVWSKSEIIEQLEARRASLLSK